MNDDVIVPRRFLGLRLGPDIPGKVLLATLSVERDDGSVLRIAFPLFDIVAFQLLNPEYFQEVA